MSNDPNQKQPALRTNDVSEVQLPALTPMQFRLLRLLKHSHERDAASLASRLVLTDTAVRQHLSVLEAAGLVVGTATREGQARGRPRITYTTTPLADLYVPDASLKVLGALARHCAETRPGTMSTWLRAHFEGVFRQWFPSDDITESEARAALSSARASGAVLSLEDGADGETIVRVHQCPISALARELPMVCDVELDVLRTFWPNFETRRGACKAGGDYYCEFRGRLKDVEPGD